MLLPFIKKRAVRLALRVTRFYRTRGRTEQTWVCSSDVRRCSEIATEFVSHELAFRFAQAVIQPADGVLPQSAAWHSTYKVPIEVGRHKNGWLV